MISVMTMLQITNESYDRSIHQQIADNTTESAKLGSRERASKKNVVAYIPFLKHTHLRYIYTNAHAYN